jgi:hypothetical protein
MGLIAPRDVTCTSCSFFQIRVRNSIDGQTHQNAVCLHRSNMDYGPLIVKPDRKACRHYEQFNPVSMTRRCE